MTIQDIIEKLELKAVTQFENRDVSGVIVSDMVSDVMAGAQSGNLWVTVQTHKSIVPAANLVDISAIVISGKVVPADTVELAKKHNIAILVSDQANFVLIGKLYELGLVSS